MTGSIASCVEVNDVPVVRVLGPNDRFLRHIEAEFPRLRLTARGNRVQLSGEPQDVAHAEQLLAEIIAQARRGISPSEADISRTVAHIRSGDISELSEPLTLSKVMVQAKTPGQRAYSKAMECHEIVFGVGPAGTGKTFLAMAYAVDALQSRQVKRIILTRPAVEAGEHLGFLPGTLSDKIDPYLRPLYDALHSLMDPQLLSKLITSGVIEVAPLAYMRGRTLEKSFIVLDEAQNTTREQMQMFLTRLGAGSRMVITGDLTQRDIRQSISGLQQALKVLHRVSGIGFCYLTSRDVVRHSLVTRIVEAYADANSAAGLIGKAENRMRRK